MKFPSFRHHPRLTHLLYVQPSARKASNHPQSAQSGAITHPETASKNSSWHASAAVGICSQEFVSLNIDRDIYRGTQGSLHHPKSQFIPPQQRLDLRLLNFGKEGDYMCRHEMWIEGKENVEETGSIAREAESEESEEDSDDSDEEIADMGYHQAAAPRCPLVGRAVNRYNVPDDDLEEIELPYIAAASAQIAAVAGAAGGREDEDIFDLAQELERELESSDDALNMDMNAGSLALVVQGDDVMRPVGLGIGVQGGPMMSLR
ncbi:hypothetical protein RUND412_009312 [Rhizina undulata]